MPLENPPTRIEHNSGAMTLTILCLSPIYRISIPLCLSTLHLLNINDIRNWPILFKREKKTLDNESIFWILIGSRSILIGSTSIEVGLNLFRKEKIASIGVLCVRVHHDYYLVMVLILFTSISNELAKQCKIKMKK